MSRIERPSAFFWFRRDLRLSDNTALLAALESGNPVQCIFIFDTEILESLNINDSRVSFIHERLEALNQELSAYGSGLLCLKGNPLVIWPRLLKEYSVEAVYANRDYEPYARLRDFSVEEILRDKHIPFHTFKDQVIFEPTEILKADRTPYTVYTPYKKVWLERFQSVKVSESLTGLFFQELRTIPSLLSLGFQKSRIVVRPFQLDSLSDYGDTRDFPALDSTSHLSVHLRFGTISIRKVVASLENAHPTFLNELIWREFFMQILYHYPHSHHYSFRSAYDRIEWRNVPEEFDRWCSGTTGYPLVDAGMRELKQSGIMHNRVRMVVASFLCKHLLIDWRWGETWFAQHLLDFDLSANVGNWQWAAGTGCDAAPYFRVFNPTEQQRKFDPDFEYIRKWVPEYGTSDYPKPMVEHSFARERALLQYKIGLNRN